MRNTKGKKYLTADDYMLDKVLEKINQKITIEIILLILRFWLIQMINCQMILLLKMLQVNVKWYGFIYLFSIGIHYIQDETATKRHGVTRKRSTKSIKKICLERTYS